MQRDQLRDHEAIVQRLESELELHRKHPPERGAKQLTLYNFREKDAYLQYEVFVTPFLFSIIIQMFTLEINMRSV